MGILNFSSAEIPLCTDVLVPHKLCSLLSHYYGLWPISNDLTDSVLLTHHLEVLSVDQFDDEKNAISVNIMIILKWNDTREYS